MPDLRLRVGADPEFSILYGGQRMSADKVIMSLFQKDQRLTGHTLKTAGGEFGCDGCSATGELRPKPDFDPKKVADNIQTCIAAFMEKGKNFELSTLSLWAPIGGHIHLELPEGATERKIKDWHKKLMSLYLPIILGEQKVNLSIRMKSYGQMSDYRTGDGKPTCEIRTPSAEWLTSRKIAEATLAYMSVAWQEITKNPKAIPEKLLLRTEKQQLAMQELAISDFESLNKAMLKDISKAFRKFEGYAAFKDEIDYILDPKKVLKDKKEFEFCINKGWGFTNGESITTKRGLMKKVTEIPETDSLFLGVAHNDDINTGFFADELKKRVAKGLKLKNNYFIFGLKKDVPGALVAKKDQYFIVPKINTENDIVNIERAKNKMVEKANVFTKEERKIDWKKNTVVEERKNAVIIGLPHEARAKKNIKEFLQIVWDIEKDNLKPLVLAVPSPKVGAEDAISGGALAVEPSDLRDSNSSGLRQATQALEEIQMEHVNQQGSEVREAQIAEFISYVRAQQPIQWRSPERNRGIGVLLGGHRGDYLVLRTDREGWTSDRPRRFSDSEVVVPYGTYFLYSVSEIEPLNLPHIANVTLRIEDERGNIEAAEDFTVHTNIPIAQTEGETPNVTTVTYRI